MKAIFCTCSLAGPTQMFIDSLERAIHPVIAAGWEHGLVEERGNVYISYARSLLLYKAMREDPDFVVFLDFDVSCGEGDLLKLLETKGDVVGGTYRFKQEKEEYMGGIYTDDKGLPIPRADGALSASHLPAGFLKISRATVELFMRAHPELIYGPQYAPRIDLFNHGARDRQWIGEDYSFCKRWIALGQPIWLVPDLDLVHHAPDVAYLGNYHKFLQRQPGGSASASPRVPEKVAEAFKQAKKDLVSLGVTDENGTLIADLRSGDVTG